MNQEVYRASRCFDLVSARKNCEEIELELGDCSSVQIDPKSYKQIFKFNYESLVYSIHDNTVVVADLRSGKSRCFKFNQQILPYLEPTTAKFHKLTDAYLITNTGLLFALGMEGVSATMKLPFIPTAFCQANDRFYLGKNTGEIYCIENGEVLFIANKQTSFIKSIINKIHPSNSILSMESFDNSIYALTKDSKIYTIHSESGKIIETNSLWNKPCISGTIKVFFDSIVMILRNETSSILKVLKKSHQDFSIVFETEFHNILDATIGKDYITVIQGDAPDVSICKYNLETGKFVASEWSPLDDYDLYIKYQFPTLEKFSKIDIDEKNMISPKSCAIDNNNFTYISSNSYIYILRPFFEIENILLFMKEEPELNSLEGVTTAMLRLVPKQIWNEIDAELKSGSDPSKIFQKIVANLDINAPKQISESKYLQRLDEIINLIHIPAPNEEFLKGTDYSVFWASAVSQIARAVAFYSKCIYLTTLFLESKLNFNVGTRLNSLSTIVESFTKLSVIIEGNNLFQLRIFEPLDYHENNFNEDLSRQIRQLLHPTNVAQALLEKGLASTVISYLHLFNGHFIEYGLALVQLKRFPAAVAYFADHRDEFDFTLIYRSTILEISKYDDTSAIKFGELIINIDRPFISSVIFMLYCKNGMTDKALDIALSLPEDRDEKMDMIRMAISQSVTNNDLKKLTKTDFGKLYNEIGKEMSVLSYKTLPAAAMLYQSHGDFSEAASILYRHGRELLRMNSLSAMKEAMTSLSMASSIMEMNKDIAVRDVFANQLLSSQKIHRIVERLRVVLRHPEPLECQKMSNLDILRFAKKDDFESFLKFAKSGVPTFGDVAVIAKEIALNNEDSLLMKLLQIDNSEWHFSLHTAVLTSFISAKIEPPQWFMEQIIKVAKTQFVVVCAENNANDVLDKGIQLMIEQKCVLPPPFNALLSQIGVRKDFIEKIVDSI
ncbi:hypothetical protein TVAG_186150 [Trichomonas vaginalis G3]|uniref:Uncharacterized protein n=1 Tax=Trichomonas vaginalis (strain ATCC PRA-98 / G3) TaxID=412133 RepID=A2D8Q8_TRIV3|nr:hypothetical protein TVAGG3_0391810 [Trichomonas vaginalis G3]EAY23307.1 hypothetical protein TVAG_186150 [Trichomonas vaginalis G3]KAI5534040.1 hypothetical protein TVAGG3_0391810 [Trichomonas vaginalis G3]|eukprot:XP_001584293.1 hypothetical protein [Trichomonas vaginalis G3]